MLEPDAKANTAPRLVDRLRPKSLGGRTQWADRRADCRSATAQGSQYCPLTAAEAFQVLKISAGPGLRVTLWRLSVAIGAPSRMFRHAAPVRRERVQNSERETPREPTCRWCQFVENRGRDWNTGLIEQQGGGGLKLSTKLSHLYKELRDRTHNRATRVRTTPSLPRRRHEAYLKPVDQSRAQWSDGYFARRGRDAAHSR